MATCHPRPKWFESTTTSTSTTLSFRFLIISILSLWLIYIFNSSSITVLGEVVLDPELHLGKEGDLLERVPRSIITFGTEDDTGSNPTVLEGIGGGSEKIGRSLSNDAYETLRQLSLASAQPFIRRKLFNTSVALTVPMFSFTLPQKAAEGSTVDLANQAIFGLFALLTSILVFAVPVVFTGVRPFDVDGRSNNGESTQDILDNLMKVNKSSRMINLMGADLQNKIGLNPDQCLQKTICDAHRSPKKYGMFALPFQLFFPPPSPSAKNSGKSTSIYQMAAETGEYKKDEECWDKYNCFFDVMELAMYLVNYFNPGANNLHDNNNLMDS